MKFCDIVELQILRSLNINLFLANVPILHPLKTPENLWFFGVFKGYKIGTLVRNGLTVQIQLAVQPCDSFFIINRNMYATVEKYRVVVLNIKLQLKIK